MEEPQEELEKIIRKSMELVICEHDDCSLRGEYWKCYAGNHARCSIYKSWLKGRNRRDY